MCPTCGHAWHTLFRGMVPVAEFCPRCGTINGKFFGEDDPIVPKLVERCRQFEPNIGGDLAVLWHRNGIAESINVPKRPT